MRTKRGSASRLPAPAQPPWIRLWRAVVRLVSTSTICAPSPPAVFPQAMQLVRLGATPVLHTAPPLPVRAALPLNVQFVKAGELSS